MSDKLEALSQPIGYVGTNCKNSVASGNLGYIKPNDAFGESPVYSQEYVTALLAAVEEKDQEIARLLELVDKYTDYGTQQRLRAETAEQRLQQPEATQQGVQILTEAIGAHGYIVGCLERKQVGQIRVGPSLDLISVSLQIKTDGERGHEAERISI
jgi:hypothetical protein